MTKLERLIEELCPDGVEKKRVDEICNISRGRVISKDYINENQGNYPVYSSQTENDGELGKISTFDYDGEYLTWTTDGANAGTVFYRVGKFSVTNVCGLLKVKNDAVSPKYLYYYLNLKAPEYVNSGMGNPKLMSNVMAKIKIPVPPLEVQAEIVRILDNFRVITTKLKSELSAELTARKKQYEYYRDRMLTYGSEFQHYMIKDVCRKVCSGGTPNTNKAEYYGGTIPWLRTQEVDFCEINETGVYITDDGLSNSSAKWIPANCVIIAMYGATVGKVAYNAIPLTTNQACCNLEIDENKAHYKYVYYWLANKYEYIKSLGQGSQTNINAQIVRNLEITLPPIQIQSRIVEILDNFESICSDLNIGLPAEIEARQKQYEYYRDKLLTFKELKK